MSHSFLPKVVGHYNDTRPDCMGGLLHIFDISGASTDLPSRIARNPYNRRCSPAVPEYASNAGPQAFRSQLILCYSIEAAIRAH